MPFTGKAKIKLENDGEIYYGDTVVLKAVVTDANTAYQIRWEFYDEDDSEWKAISGVNGDTYKFTLTEENAGLVYRVVLITEA